MNRNVLITSATITQKKMMEKAPMHDVDVRFLQKRIYTKEQHLTDMNYARHDVINRCTLITANAYNAAVSVSNKNRINFGNTFFFSTFS